MISFFSVCLFFSRRVFESTRQSQYLQTIGNGSLCFGVRSRSSSNSFLLLLKHEFKFAVLKCWNFLRSVKKVIFKAEKEKNARAKGKTNTNATFASRYFLRWYDHPLGSPSRLLTLSNIYSDPFHGIPVYTGTVYGVKIEHKMWIHRSWNKTHIFSGKHETFATGRDWT